MPIPVSHLETALYAQLQQADVEVIAALQLITQSTGLELHDEIERIQSAYLSIFLLLFYFSWSLICSIFLLCLIKYMA